MNRAGWIRAVALISGLILSGRVEAQAVNGVRAGWGGVDLLAHPIVRDELKLDATQLEKAKALASARRGRQKELLAKLEGLAGEERAKKAQEVNAILAEEEGKALAELLNPGQLARFGQVDLQQRGASAWLDPKVARSLDLTAEQSEKLAQVLNRSMIRRREAQSNTRGDRRATLEKVQAIRKETDAQAVALLTPEQAATWNAMTGEPLDLNPAPVPRAGR